MSDILTLDTNGFPVVKKSISVSVGSADGGKLVETNPSSGKIDDSLIPSSILAGGLTLGSPIESYTPTVDLTSLSNVDSIIKAFEKLQAQVLSKDTSLKIEYLTGTTVLSHTQNAAIIDSFSDCNIFLPLGEDNLKYRLRNVGTGRATFIPYGTDTIEKVSSYTLLTTNAFDLVFLNGNWFLF